MKYVIAALLALSSMSASADCWVVEGMKGTSFSERNADKSESCVTQIESPPYAGFLLPQATSPTHQ
ncbi:hypothetical protein QT13_01990 [Pectobacterium brasiliense]|uniref:hypothetical protein n=1 Tax=Pectobacterium brasiliense TaxID=180957 RepID=UPI00057C3AAE|nr:hypothetical protein [Pectobacterium brasiliense]KHS77034.1 hypothetical protein QT13_01990 [Pectobacterium brasiliense]